MDELLQKIKAGWNLSKTNKIKPMGYKGYNLTIYEKDDTTIKVDIYAKTLDNLKKKLEFYLKNNAGSFLPKRK